MTHKVTNVLTTDEANKLADIIVNNSEKFREESDGKYYRNSKGGWIKEADVFTERIETYVKSFYSQPIEFSNSFCRIYSTGSYLGIHTDRVGLDITVSLCLRKDPNINWPIHISNKLWQGRWDHNRDYSDSEYKKDYISVDLDPGDMALCLGTQQPHWRDILQCDENQKFIYTFYHWRFSPNN